MHLLASALLLMKLLIKIKIAREGTLLSRYTLGTSVVIESNTNKNSC